MNVLIALALLAQDTVASEGSDLSKLAIGRTYFGTPVHAADLQGRVVLWRAWSG